MGIVELFNRHGFVVGVFMPTLVPKACRSCCLDRILHVLAVRRSAALEPVAIKVRHPDPVPTCPDVQGKNGQSRASEFDAFGLRLRPPTFQLGTNVCLR